MTKSMGQHTGLLHVHPKGYGTYYHRAHPYPVSLWKRLDLEHTLQHKLKDSKKNKIFSINTTNAKTTIARTTHTNTETRSYLKPPGD